MLFRSLPGEAQIVVNVCCAFPKESSPPVLTTAPRYRIPTRAGVSRQTPDTAALDEPRQRRPPVLRLLLSPGLSDRLACRSADEWSSSNSGVSEWTTDTRVYGGREEPALAVLRRSRGAAFAMRRPTETGTREQGTRESPARL
jgi:hypothetical protein